MTPGRYTGQKVAIARQWPLPEHWPRFKKKVRPQRQKQQNSKAGAQKACSIAKSPVVSLFLGEGFLTPLSLEGRALPGDRLRTLQTHHCKQKKGEGFVAVDGF